MDWMLLAQQSGGGSPPSTSWWMDALQWVVDKVSAIPREFLRWLMGLLKSFAEPIFAKLAPYLGLDQLSWPDLSPLMAFFSAANDWLPLQEAWALLVLYAALWSVLIGVRWTLKVIGLLTTGGW
jgi:hypothetical protein